MTDPAKVKADIIPFTPEYSRLVHGWIDSAETYKDLCRGIDYPPPDDIVDSWQRDEVSSYILFANKKPAAYAELWKRPLEIAVEIAHLIVDPSLRGTGHGTKMLELLYLRAGARKNIAKVIITLYGSNRPALGCYMKAGFELIGTTTYTEGLKLVRLVE